MTSVKGLRLVASGHSHPTTELATEHLEAVLPNVKGGWIAGRLGMSTRRVAAPHERMADHGITAVQDALGRAGWDASDLDLIVCGASFLEELMPARAAVIAEAVQPAAIAFDVNAACSSFLYALAVADALLQTRTEIRRAAVCVVERPTASADYRDSHSSVFFGDSAGCVLIEREHGEVGFAVESLILLNDAIGCEDVRVPRHGHFHHDNSEAFRHVILMGAQSAKSAMHEAGVGVDDIRVVVGHQANEAVLRSLGDQVGIGWDRQWHNFEWAGNQGAGGVLTAFSQGWVERSSELHPDDRVMLNTVGSGYSAAAAVLRWLG